MANRLFVFLIGILCLGILCLSHLAGCITGGSGSTDELFLFSATDGSRGRELWRSDGTAAGTFLVKDINSGAGESKPYHFTQVGGTVFFVADDGSRGVELWRSDGTAAGTALVKDIYPGTGSSGILGFER